MKYSDQKKKMKMANGGLPEDINLGDIEARVRQIGNQLREQILAVI